MPKPKSFQMTSENLDPIMPVIKSFDKHLSIVKTKVKALGSTFRFRKSSYNEIEKIISNLSIKKSSQQEDIPTKIIKLNKNLFAKFIIKNFKFCIRKGKFSSELKHSDITPKEKRKRSTTKVNTDH